MAREKSVKKHARKPTTQGISRKEFHRILDKASQPVKKEDKEK